MALKLISGNTGDIKVFATDYKVFIRELNKIDRQQSIELRKDFRKIGAKAQKSVQDEIKTIGPQGPMSGMRHGGRTGWGRNYGSTGGPVSGAKRYPYNSVFVEAFARAKSGQTGIARVRVRSAGTVLADLAVKFRGIRTTRPYKIRLFGGPEITRTHTTSYKSSGFFIRNLGGIVKPSKRKKSRNVYPGFDKALPEVTKEAKIALQRAINFIKNNIDRTTR